MSHFWFTSKGFCNFLMGENMTKYVWLRSMKIFLTHMFHVAILILEILVSCSNQKFTNQQLFEHFFENFNPPKGIYMVAFFTPEKSTFRIRNIFIEMFSQLLKNLKPKSCLKKNVIYLKDIFQKFWILLRCFDGFRDKNIFADSCHPLK